MLTLARIIKLIPTTFIPLLNPSIDAQVSTADAANEVRAQVHRTVESGLERVDEQRRSWELHTQVSALRHERALLEQQLESLCVWEHQELDGEVVTTVLPLECSETVRSRSTKVVSTAYYSPLEGQSRYATGTLDGDRKLNGQGVRTADGTAPYRGTVAAPPVYAFGTMLYVDGFGAGKVHDRGGAIQRHDSHDRIDLWMGAGDAGLRACERWGVQEHEAAVFVAGAPEDIETILTRFVG
jgi:3D (Asp-Asp-Asp) domain-containing protein